METEYPGCTETDPKVKEYWESRSGQPYGEPERTPVTVYSFGFKADELMTVYGALDTYLKVLVQQAEIDLAAVERTAQIMIEIKPRAIEASKSLSERADTLKPVGTEK